MTIIASAPVPPGSRLIDLPTDPRMTVRGIFPINPAHTAHTRTAATDARSAFCPSWCTASHNGADDFDAMVEMRQHTRTVATVDRDGQRVAHVEIVAVDDLATGRRTAAEIVIAESRDSYSPDEAELIAAGLLRAARIVRDAR